MKFNGVDSYSGLEGQFFNFEKGNLKFHRAQEGVEKNPQPPAYPHMSVFFGNVHLFYQNCDSI